jgi:hypothetical protein
MDDANDFDGLRLRSPSSLRTPSTLKYAPVNRIKRARVARALSGRLDRVGVLGGENWGHTGCVALLGRSCSSFTPDSDGRRLDGELLWTWSWRSYLLL